MWEELAQAPATSSIITLVSQAVAELHLGRTEEAEAALDQALKKDPSYAQAIANLLVLNVIGGKDPKELTAYVFPKTSPGIPRRVQICMRPNAHRIGKRLTFSSFPDNSRQQTHRTPTLRISRRRASCSTRRLPSTAPRCRHRPRDRRGARDER